MINLRYHIVSITAVFLALGIGLAFGASFIDRATVDTLERNLNEIEQQNDDLEAANDELGDRISTSERIEDGLREQGLTQLVEARLTDVPVLLVVNAGIDEQVAADAEATLVAAGAQLAGVVRVTERFALDDQSEVDDLRSVLALPSSSAEQLRVAVTRQVAAILRDAGQPAVEAPSTLPVPVPPLLDELLADGFLELDPADAPPEGFALIPGSGLRIVGITGDGADVADDAFLGPVLRGSASVDVTEPDAPPPVVVVAHATAPAVEDGQDAPAPSLVELLRADDLVRERLSTVDDLDSFAGLAAAVLALAHGSGGQTGHYGVQDDAQSLLPPAVVAPADG
jgi:hypothetical protein